MRSRPEWIGKTDNAMPPPSVRLRIFERHNGICHLSERKIRPGEKWECDHVIPIWKGGENRELNMAPALVEPHKEKSAADQRQQSKERTKRMKHLGIRKPKQIIPGSKASRYKKKLSGEVVLRDDR